MRMRFKPYARPGLLACDFHVHEPLTHGGHWHELYARPDQPWHLEMGRGKGGSLAQIAPAHPDINYLGIEITDNVLSLPNRKVDAAHPERGIPADNVKIASLDIERLGNAFTPDDRVSRIYINFCNPWSKNAGSNKHRLTHPRQLLQYRSLMDEGAEIWFKTDDDDLFRDSLSYFPAAGFEITCLLYTSDAADERSSVDLGGRSIIRQKTQIEKRGVSLMRTCSHKMMITTYQI